jgi:hypothetical protein
MSSTRPWGSVHLPARAHPGRGCACTLTWRNFRLPWRGIARRRLGRRGDILGRLRRRSWRIRRRRRRRCRPESAELVGPGRAAGAQGGTGFADGGAVEAQPGAIGHGGVVDAAGVGAGLRTVGACVDAGIVGVGDQDVLRCPLCESSHGRHVPIEDAAAVIKASELRESQQN